MFARSLSASPACGACTSSCTARPFATKCSSANERTSSTRSSCDSSRSAGSATTSSRATCASLRRSAASAAFHKLAASASPASAPSGRSTSWCSGASRCLNENRSPVRSSATASRALYAAERVAEPPLAREM